jgi:hypothetical protein
MTENNLQKFQIPIISENEFRKQKGKDEIRDSNKFLDGGVSLIEAYISPTMGAAGLNESAFRMVLEKFPFFLGYKLYERLTGIQFERKNEGIIPDEKIQKIKLKHEILSWANLSAQVPLGLTGIYGDSYITDPKFHAAALIGGLLTIAPSYISKLSAIGEETIKEFYKSDGEIGGVLEGKKGAIAYGTGEISHRNFKNPVKTGIVKLIKKYDTNNTGREVIDLEKGKNTWNFSRSYN